MFRVTLQSHKLIFAFPLTKQTHIRKMPFPCHILYSKILKFLKKKKKKIMKNTFIFFSEKNHSVNSTFFSAQIFTSSISLFYKRFVDNVYTYIDVKKTWYIYFQTISFHRQSHISLLLSSTSFLTTFWTKKYIHSGDDHQQVPLRH